MQPVAILIYPNANKSVNFTQPPIACSLAVEAGIRKSYDTLRKVLEKVNTILPKKYGTLCSTLITFLYSILYLHLSHYLLFMSCMSFFLFIPVILL